MSLRVSTWEVVEGGKRRGNDIISKGKFILKEEKLKLILDLLYNPAPLYTFALSEIRISSGQLKKYENSL